MDSVYKSIKGMPDLLPSDMKIWHLVEDNIRKVMRSYSYGEIRTPVLEKTDLFKRSIGEVTDIVEKEMYTFTDRDKNDTSITLRPECTASCVRAALQNSLIRNNQQQRLWYLGPMYRRERPQKGRYRQFYQFGIEFFSMRSVDAEIEQLQVAYDIFASLGVLEYVRLEINSLGSAESRARFTDSLVAYFKENVDKLDEDSKRRLETNPLRILDSKSEAMKDLLDNAPSILDYLSDSEAKDLDKVKSALNALEIPFVVNPRIVRGLDYYQGLVYEWVTDKLGSQSAVCAGGRYDGLIEQLGGGSGFGVGFAMGIERLISLVELTKREEINLGAYLFCVGDLDSNKVHRLIKEVRSSVPNLELWVNWAKAGVGNHMKKANKNGARWALIVGEQELESGRVSVKDMLNSGEQTEVELKDLKSFMGI